MVIPYDSLFDRWHTINNRLANNAMNEIVEILHGIGIDFGQEYHFSSDIFPVPIATKMYVIRYEKSPFYTLFWFDTNGERHMLCAEASFAEELIKIHDDLIYDVEEKEENEAAYKKVR